MFSAFQSNAFQNNAFQILQGVTEPTQQGGGGIIKKEKYIAQSYELGKFNWELEQKELNEKRELAEKQLALKNKEIEDLEQKRLMALADNQMQVDLVKLLREADYLEFQRQQIELQIQRIIQDEQDIIAILCLDVFIV